MKVVLTLKAASDLRAINDYISLTDPNAALSVVRRLRASMRALGDMPERFSVLPGYEETGLRRRVEGNHLIIYEISLGRVYIVHVVHGASDLDALLRGRGREQPSDGG
ncbi:type II toxin-antitoxin system RelE/ParE family toxin [Rhizobium sp. FKL33]|uniref:type II toxin-antitoxin system RelE/ParE family toxin n=1 Tax=Rhizobium sp. FKL33 TaxID=2562307 RepID=UPI0010C05AD4|nr:type II toxin-antitoxin system RelE/ParE family toxin [Rhizobium sp. FKL33]